MLTLNLKNVQLDDSQEQKLIDNELLELLLDYEIDEDSFVWIVDLNIENKQPIDRKLLMNEADFYTELFATIDDFQNLEAAISTIIEHQIGRRYLESLTEDEQRELMQKAEKLLIELLYQAKRKGDDWLKIQEIHIYGFGHLNHVVIKDLSDFQVFFGENEAGKSTIMAFIHSILFGFPTKQSSELRYEPKNGSNYGGKLRLLFEQYGLVTIERVRGKAAGDVTVSLEDGTIGDDALLKQLLGNMDKGLFQAIFSFNLHGLQNIHQMKGEDLGKFLFSTGTLGTETLAKTEAELQKELEARFKPSGKKPVVNEKLKVIHELSNELKKAAAKNQEYEQLNI